jgi:hypothetical protein
LSDLYTNLSTRTLARTPGINVDIIAAIVSADSNAAAQAFKYVWYAVVAFAVLAIGASCRTINYEEYLTDNVATKMHGSTVGKFEEAGANEKVAENESTLGSVAYIRD